jgi:DNA repair exonuclease SbcCD ATPase subunit
MKIEVNSVSFKNFLTFGARMQTLELIPGLNVVMGMDERGRSNSAGKTSLLLTIPFALFGKTDKDIKKAALVNWKNKKGCEVKLDATIGDDNITIIRCLKPDKLEIYKNGSLIPSPVDVRDYQKILEEEILHWDFNTFSSLFHTNLNSLTPVLKMSVPTKRAFLERVFDLELFSNIVTSANEKIRSIQESISKCRMEQDLVSRQLSEIDIQSNKLRASLGALPNIEIEVNDINERINDLNDRYENPEKRLQDLQDSYDSDRSKLEALLQHEVSVASAVKQFEAELVLMNKAIKSYGDNIEDKVKQLNELKANLVEVTVDEHLEGNVRQCEDSITSLTNRLHETKMSLNSMRSDHKHLLAQIELLSGERCPTCQAILKDNELLNTLTSYEREKSNSIKDVEKQIGELSNELKVVKSEHSVLLNKLSDQLRLQSIVRDQSHQLELLLPYEQQYQNYLIDIKAKSAKQQLLDECVKKQTNVKASIKTLQHRLKSYTDEMEAISSSVAKLKDLKERLISLSNRREENERSRHELESLILENDEKTRQLILMSRVNTIKINKLNDLTDYMTYIKSVCQDDGVKQYAVSHIMPDLT